MRKLLVFDVIFGARTKKLAGINDKKNFITTDVVISDSDNSITFTSIELPSFFKIDGYFRIFGGPNNKELFRIRDINGNKILTYENVTNDSTARTLDARLWVVHEDNSISRKGPTGGTMFNLDNMEDTGVDCDASQIANIYISHYHTDHATNTKIGIVPEGNKNNNNLIFTLPADAKFVEGTLEIYLSHLHLDEDQFVANATNTGFTIIINPQDRWKLNGPPLQGESLTINYLQDVA